MYLIEMLLPLTDNQKKVFKSEYFEQVQHRLTEKFGGLTAFTKNPAEGLWKKSKNTKPQHDEIIIFEVITDTFDKSWWQLYKEELKRIFQQKDIVIKVLPIELV
ncbi:hypothetical protein [Emticicia agri]|uniref:DUF1330 domain-containing protein n=1 Tax=Emticicia agri TaxID=2492393 RepID=A0A4Q5LQW5_9BACT|nr:hypothetical protein [Emticicia agri]RYU91743.1 hypothetical protein EWM59_27010 [Emticicia agri]